MNPSPVLTVSGICHSVTPRSVSAVEAQPAKYDDSGRLVRGAVEARAGYETHDVTVLTDDGGFADIVLGPEALSALGGQLPEPRAQLSFPVRPFTKWEGQPGRKFARVGLSVAGDVLARNAAGAGSGRRLAATGT